MESYSKQIWRISRMLVKRDVPEGLHLVYTDFDRGNAWARRCNTSSAAAAGDKELVPSHVLAWPRRHQEFVGHLVASVHVHGSSLYVRSYVNMQPLKIKMLCPIITFLLSRMALNEEASRILRKTNKRKILWTDRCCLLLYFAVHTKSRCIQSYPYRLSLMCSRM